MAFCLPGDKLPRPIRLRGRCPSNGLEASQHRFRDQKRGIRTQRAAFRKVVVDARSFLGILGTALLNKKMLKEST